MVPGQGLLILAFQRQGDEKFIDEGFNDIVCSLRRRHTGTRQMLATDWTGSFGRAVAFEGGYAVPYASVYLSETAMTE
jgi:hypothetical protein